MTFQEITRLDNITYYQLDKKNQSSNSKAIKKAQKTINSSNFSPLEAPKDKLRISYEKISTISQKSHSCSDLKQEIAIKNALSKLDQQKNSQELILRSSTPINFDHFPTNEAEEVNPQIGILEVTNESNHEKNERIEKVFNDEKAEIIFQKENPEALSTTQVTLNGPNLEVEEPETSQENPLFLHQDAFKTIDNFTQTILLTKRKGTKKHGLGHAASKKLHGVCHELKECFHNPVQQNTLNTLAQTSATSYSMQSHTSGAIADLGGLGELLKSLGESYELIEEFKDSAKAMRTLKKALMHLRSLDEYQNLKETKTKIDAEDNLRAVVYYQFKFRKSMGKAARAVTGAISGSSAMLAGSAELAHASIAAACLYTAGSASLVTGGLSLVLATRNLYNCFSKKQQIKLLKETLKLMRNGGTETEAYQLLRQFKHYQHLQAKYKTIGNAINAIGGTGAITLGITGLILIAASPPTMGATLPFGLAAVGLTGLSLFGSTIMKEMAEKETTSDGILLKNRPVGLSMRTLLILEKEDLERSDQERLLIHSLINYYGVDNENDLKTILIIELAAYQVTNQEDFKNTKEAVMASVTKQS